MLLSFDRYLYLRYNINTCNKLSRIMKENIKFSVMKSLCKTAFREKFIRKISSDKKNKIYFLQMNPYTSYDVTSTRESIRNENMIGYIAVREVYKCKEEKVYTIALLCIREEVRNVGYGGYILRELEKIIAERTKKKVKIYLHALPKSVNFYKRNGYEETNNSKYVEILERIERNDVILCKKIKS